LRTNILIIAAIIAVSVPSFAAYKIDPTIVSLDVSGGERSAVVELTNTGDGPVAIELEVLERVLDLDGELDMKAMLKSKDFTTYPSEIILKSGEKVGVQIQYKKKEKVTSDKAYILSSKEVLIPLEEEEKDGINISIPAVMSYYTIVALETGKEGKLAFVSSKAIAGDKVELIVENRGNGRVRTEGLLIKTSTDIIKGFTGVKNSIMPGQKRRFTFKYLRPLTSKEVKFVYDGAK